MTTLFLLVSSVKNAWGYNSVPSYAIMVWCLIKGRDTLTSLDLSLILKEEKLIEKKNIWGESKRGMKKMQAEGVSNLYALLYFITVSKSRTIGCAGCVARIEK
jgi:hypothetical protein